MPILIVCIEGTHGSGKTTLIHYLNLLGVPTIDEGFLDIPKTLLAPTVCSI